MSRINTTTGEIHDHEPIDAATADQLRACDMEIARIDQQIEEAKDELKSLKQERENALARMRKLVRGERALPFADDDDPPIRDGEAPMEYAARRQRELRGER